MATFDFDPLTPTDPIVFNVSTLNPGGYYNASSGNYTVPIDGVYEFMVHIWVLQDSGFDAYLAVDGVRVLSFSYSGGWGSAGEGGQYLKRNFAKILKKI